MIRYPAAGAHVEDLLRIGGAGQRAHELTVVPVEDIR